MEQKRVIIIAFDENNDSEKEIVKMFPIWQTKAFIDTTSLRYMNIEKSEMLLKEKNFSLPLEMRIFFEGNETQRINDLEAIKNWWKSEKRDYKGEKIFHSLAENSEKNSENDPLKI